MPRRSTRCASSRTCSRWCRGRGSIGSTLLELPSSSNNMIWLVEHATVRATKQQPQIDVQLPAKKRAASITARVQPARA